MSARCPNSTGDEPPLSERLAIPPSCVTAFEALMDITSAQGMDPYLMSTERCISTMSPASIRKK